jgi:DNA polymerase-3 subunit epsilon
VRRIVLDTETTGLDHNGPDRIIEVACVELNDTLPTGLEFQSYVNPRVTVRPDAFRVHGISDAFLSDKPEFEDVVDDLMSFIGDAEIVAHNAPFDLAFVNKELRLIGRPALTNQVVDSLALARARRPHKRNSLDALATDFKVTTTRVDGVHGALEDARLLAKVFCHLVQAGGSGSLDLRAYKPATEVIDFSKLKLRVGEPTAEELAAHRDMCKQLGIRPF